jgi:hypothetical protein
MMAIAGRDHSRLQRKVLIPVLNRVERGCGNKNKKRTCLWEQIVITWIPDFS